MALISEQVVEEWLRRKGFFTIRGVKLGVHEIDILALRCKDGQIVEACHYEVQVSYKPVGMLVPKGGMEELIEKKFLSERKKALRAELVGSEVKWTYHFVVHKLADPGGIKIFEPYPEIEAVPFADVCKELADQNEPRYKAADRDLVDLMMTLC